VVMGLLYLLMTHYLKPRQTQALANGDQVSVSNVKVGVCLYEAGAACGANYRRAGRAQDPGATHAMNAGSRTAPDSALHPHPSTAT
jgi:hypothetical protein